MKSALVLIPEKIAGLLNDYAKDLEEAWANVGAGESLNINLSAKVGFDKHDKPCCEVTIAFIKEKVKGSVTFNWDDKQPVLFQMVKDLDTSLKKKNTTMTITGGGGEVATLGKKAPQ